MARIAISRTSAHICVDMQRMFAGGTEWSAPWLLKILPAVAAIASAHRHSTIFTRFIPPEKPSDPDGAWSEYYERWRSMTRNQLPAGMVELVPELQQLVPPARVVDKKVYSPWVEPELHRLLCSQGVDTLLVTGGETDICVLATVLGAIDLGYRVVLPTDAVYGSADETHDAMLQIYRSRFGQQLTVCTAQDILDAV